MGGVVPALTDRELYASGREHEAWAGLRRASPVSWSDGPNFEGYWSVTTYAKSVEVLGDWERFSSTGGTILRPHASAPYPGAGRMLALVDPPRHTELRHPLRPLFAPRRIACLRDAAAENTRVLLASTVGAGVVDFVSTVAARLTLPVTAGLFDISPGRQPDLAAALSAGAESGTNVDAGAFQAAHLQLLEFYAERVAFTGSRPPVAEPASIVSALHAARRQGADISDEDIILTCDNVVFAAAETTTQAAAGGVYALACHPHAWNRLKNDRSLIDAAVEEILRWSAPARHVARTATTTTVLDGVPIAAGDTVAVWLASANRDGAAFDHPGHFDIGRQANRHLTFGFGHHRCLGATLSRLLLRVLLEQLLESVSEIRVACPPTFSPSFVIGGLSHLPVELSPR